MGHYRLQKNRDQAEHANQIQTSFLTNISHELRTPLNGILGFTRLALAEDSNEEDKTRYKRIIDSSSRQLLNIVDNIILMSELETGQTEAYIDEFNLTQLLSVITNEFKHAAEQKGLLFIHESGLPAENYRLKSDAQKLRIILNNLLDNAVKFTINGSVTLRTGLSDESFRFEVEDAGIGISKEHMEKIFEGFYQTDIGYNRQIRRQRPRTLDM